MALGATLVLAGGTALGGGVAAADPGGFTAGDPEPVAIHPNPAVIRWMRAVAVCSEMYPPGTDITDCIRNLY